MVTPDEDQAGRATEQFTTRAKLVNYHMNKDNMKVTGTSTLNAASGGPARPHRRRNDSYPRPIDIPLRLRRRHCLQVLKALNYLYQRFKLSFLMCHDIYGIVASVVLSSKHQSNVLQLVVHDTRKSKVAQATHSFAQGDRSPSAERKSLSLLIELASNMARYR
eukprot:scaffold120_cov59-Cylindrotheca_fusiformis.AAC.8